MVRGGCLRARKVFNAIIASVYGSSDQKTIRVGDSAIQQLSYPTMSDMSLEIRVLGNPIILFEGEPVAGLPSRAAEALLIYLVCQEHPVTREFLAELLWSDRSQQQALANLRSILSSLRRVVGDRLVVTRQMVGFNFELANQVDASVFERELGNLLPLFQTPIPLDPQTLTRLKDILALYRGDFLTGFYLREGRGFEEWATLTRERLRRLAGAGLRRLVQHFLETGKYLEGIEHARRLITIDPYDEDARRQLMWLFVRSGQPNHAFREFETLRKLLSDELGVPPAPATVSLYNRFRALSFPPPFFLPARAASFVGRETEIAELQHILAAPDSRLLTLSGPGGIGKTRLGLEAARHISQQTPGQFIDGIAFVSLIGVNAAQWIPLKIAEVLALPLHGSAAPVQQVLDYLQNKEMLLVLDDFEQFLGKTSTEGLAFLMSLLSTAPDVKLLITSRERLNLYEEIVFDVPGLGLPDDEPNPEYASAVALFLQTARRQRQFSPTPDELKAIARVCQLVQGVPLAIELAAGWIRQYPAVWIVKQIEQSLDFLHSSFRNLPERHRSLRAVFDHSWDLLTPLEQAVFCQLAIFEGDFSREAAEAVISDQYSVISKQKAEPWTLHTEHWLAAFSDKSLLQPQTQGRYALHSLLRQFAAEKQAEFTDAWDTTSQRHARYFLEFVARQPTGEAPPDRTAIRTELANIRAAWQWAVHRKDFSLLGPAIPILHNFFSIQSWFQEGIELFQLATTGLGEVSAPTLEQATVICELFGRKARMGIHIGQLQMAREDLEKAQTVLPLVNDPVLRSKVLDSLAISYYYAGDYPQASRIGEEILQLAEAVNRQETAAFALNFLGSCAKVQGAYAKAFDLFKRSAEVYKTMNDPIGAAMSLNNMGNLAQITRRFAAARQYYQESSTLFKRADHLHGASTTLANEGKLALQEGDYEGARRLLTESLEFKEKMNDSRGQAVALISLGDVSAQTGKTALARQQYAQALSLAHTAGDIRLVLEILVAIMEFWSELGQTRPAAKLWAFIRQHPALSQEAQERAENAAAKLQKIPTPTDTLEAVVADVLKDLGSLLDLE